MENLNRLCDIAEISIMGAAFITCLLYLMTSYLRIQQRSPCEVKIAESRDEFIYANLHTAVLNTFNTGFFVTVLGVWYAHKRDTAPDFVDVLVLLLVIMTAVTLVRSSVCARQNIIRLIRVRVTDSGCSDCLYCKFKEKKDDT